MEIQQLGLHATGFLLTTCMCPYQWPMGVGPFLKARHMKSTLMLPQYANQLTSPC